MKILLVTDSHKQLSYLMKMVEEEKPDQIFALGDYSSDFEELSYLYPEIPISIVRGNCDFWDRQNPEEKIVEIYKTRILLTHGHLYRVKLSLGALLERTKELQCDIVVFGHTHKEFFSEEEVMCINPGAAEDKKYAIIQLEKNMCDVKFKKL